MARLPQPGGDEGNWGNILNDFLSVAHTTSGAIKSDAVDGSALQDQTVTPTKVSATNTPTAGQLLSYDGTSFQWVANSGAQGPPGEGVTAGGTTGQILAKASNTNYDTEWVDQTGGAVNSVNGQTGTVVLDAGEVGLGNVNNTSDANKPISTATQDALDDKADLIVVNDLSSDVSDLQTNKADVNYRYWNGSGGVGAWDDRPSVPSGRHVDAYSVLDELAPTPPDAVEGDLWFRHPDAT